MCGISGIINFAQGVPVAKDILSSMNNSLVHRGPDEQGIFICENVGLAHRRLSIIDLSSGAQPMFNEDKSIVIVFNGEIYNFPELKVELEAKGHVFQTHSDTEVILHLYEEHQGECVNFLNGMFAFALYDMSRKYILIARDRLGQKPLFYFHSQGAFAFASELAALKKHPGMPRKLDLQAIHDFLSLQYVPSPGTIYQGVKKVPPGHILELNSEQGGFRLKRYWNLDFSKKTKLSFDEAKEEFSALLEDSVKKRMISDVPLGAFLSGGIDSTVVVGLMAKHSAAPVKTFTIGFKEDKYDERKYADIAVNGISESIDVEIEHYEKIVEPADFQVVEELVKHYGEPYSDASMLPTYLLSKFTREHVTVALSGDGADELFAGYYRYLVMKFAKAVDIIPLPFRAALYNSMRKLLPPKIEERSFIGQIQRILGVIAAPANERYLRVINRFDEQMKNEVYGEAFGDFRCHKTLSIISALYSIASARNPVEKIMELDIHSYLHGDILTKVDIASMANSLEVRSPFMDYRVAEFAASLPLSFKQYGCNRKHILKETFKNNIPKSLYQREKMGFGVPVAKWFRGRWDTPLRGHLLDGLAVKEGFFERDVLERMIGEHQKMKADHSYSLWAMLIFELFLKSDT